jgi:hypothetical protein
MFSSPVYVVPMEMLGYQEDVEVSSAKEAFFSPENG